MSREWRVWISRHVPIVGSLATISIRAQYEALVEMFLSVIFSTLPIWFVSLVVTIEAFAKTRPDSHGVVEFIHLYWGSMVRNLGHGELLMYVTALLGPTLYIGLSSFGRRGKPFPWVRPQLVAAILVSFLATVLFFQARADNFVVDQFLVSTSIFLYVMSLAILFPALAYEHQGRVADAADLQREDQENFQNAYSRHREQ